MSDIAKLKTKQHTYPRLDKSKYQKRAGLEGPFMTKSGQVVYYDHKKGQYLDPDKDMYLSYDDWKKLSESRIVGLNKKSVEYKNGRAAAEKASKEEAKVVAEAAAAPYLKLVEEAKTRAREYQDAATAKAMECQGLGSSAVAQANEANVF